jgi:hypothetical protein
MGIVMRETSSHDVEPGRLSFNDLIFMCLAFPLLPKTAQQPKLTLIFRVIFLMGVRGGVFKRVEGGCFRGDPPGRV